VCKSHLLHYSVLRVVDDGARVREGVGQDRGLVQDIGVVRRTVDLRRQEGNLRKLVRMM